MLNPWNLLGWVVLIFVLVCLYQSNKHLLRRYLRYLNSRNTALAVGQCWVQGDTILRVEHYYPDTKRFGIRAGNASWGETQAEWNKRVRTRHLYLADF